MNKFISLFAAAALLCSCACNGNRNSDNNGETAEMTEMAIPVFEDLDGDWNIVGIKDVESVEEGWTMSFDIAGNMMNAYLGCNYINGNISRKGRASTSLSFENTASTKMLCENEAAEVAFLAVVETVMTFSTEGENVVLKNENDEVVITLSK